MGSWGYGDDGKEEEDAGKGELGASHELAGEELWWENGPHHYTATQLSGHVTGLGLSRLCITPSERLKNLLWMASETTTSAKCILVSGRLQECLRGCGV